MKNIHVLPTDKPSRLHLGNSGLVFFNLNYNSSTINTQHIYITSDEEIKEGEYGFIGNVVGKIYNKKFYKKIILTTDQDLINDGVQAIDDEFLEWFVNNPTCEWVEVEKECCDQCDERLCEVNDLGRKETKENTFYKIIIPK